ncbi:unnamed protein product, partial [Brachionus calyciflorus]
MNIENDEQYNFFEKLRDFGLLLGVSFCTNVKCKKLGNQMVLNLRKRDKNSEKKLLSWRCNSCTTYKSVYDGSFFSLFRKPPKIIVAIIKCWSGQITIRKT